LEEISAAARERNSAPRHRVVAGAAIDRASLLDRLDGLRDRPLIWISGPAGSGKSTFVEQWIAQRWSDPIVWIDCARNGAEETGRRLAEVVRGATDRAPALVVVDGVESADLGAQIIDLAKALTDGDDRRPQLVAIGRAAPPPGLTPLTLRGVGAHLDGRDLELDGRETAAVITAYSGEAISARAAEDVAEQLQGWMAGTVIVGMAHRHGHGASADELIAAGSDGIEAYIAAEILERATDDQRAFLLLTACADDLAPALCDAMTGRIDGELLLGGLRSAGLPLARRRTSTGWARHIAPIRRGLDARASREMPDRRADALRAAAAWYSANGFPFEAAWCHVRLGEWDDVINVVFLHLQRILESDEMSRLAELVAVAPPSFMRQHVGLVLQGAWVLLMEGQVAGASELLAAFEPHMQPVQHAIATGIRSDMVSWVPDAAGCLALAEAGIAEFDEIGADGFDAVARTTSSYTTDTDDTYRSLLRANAVLAGSYAGMWDRGARHLVELSPETAATLPQIRIVQRLGFRAGHLVLAGRVGAAQREAGTALMVAAEAGLLDNRHTADAHFANGEAMRLGLRHREAADALSRSAELARANKRRNLIATVVAAQAQVRLAAGDHSAALELIEAVRRETNQRLPHTIAGLLAAAHARAAIAAGDLRSALRVADAAPFTPPVASARVAALLVLERITDARDVVQQWPTEPTVDSEVRRDLAMAAICEAGRGTAAADTAFRSALTRAAEHGLMQPFVELGPVVGRLLQRATNNKTGPAAQELGQRIHAAIVGGEIATVNPRLTAREATLLAHLAAGRSMREIADDVHLSINTVKTHVQAIYRKLGVNSRLEAIRVHHASTPADRHEN